MKYNVYDMNLTVEPGKYVIAVSGGVDSVVLLDLLASQAKNSELVVAHFDHGIRKGSGEDRKFVEKLAENYRFKFFFGQAKLGPKASEALAREKRYEFLKSVQEKIKADGIITAHHQDDVIETIAINLIRGTGRKGLSSLTSRPSLLRPLLKSSKAELIGYAKENHLNWHEDETNKDEAYLRNFVRHNLVNKLSSKQQNLLLEIYQKTATANLEIDQLIKNLFFKDNRIKRSSFNSLSHELAREVVAVWLRAEKLSFDKKTIERLVISLKTTRENRTIQINKTWYFTVEKGIIRLKRKGSV